MGRQSKRRRSSSAPLESRRESESPQSARRHTAGGSRAQREHGVNQSTSRRQRRCERRRTGRPDAAHGRRSDIECRGRQALASQGREPQRERRTARADPADVGGCFQPGPDDARTARSWRGGGRRVCHRSHDAARQWRASRPASSSGGNDGDAVRRPRRLHGLRGRRRLWRRRLKLDLQRTQKA